jgi:hypothetical protein
LFGHAVPLLSRYLVSGQDKGKRSRSQSSSVLSDDVPNAPTNKRRRINSTSDEDAEEDPEGISGIPLTTPTISKGAKKVPPIPVLSGARINARASKKRAGGATAPAKKAPQTNGASSMVPKIKVEEDLDNESVADTTTTGPEEAAPTMSIDVSVHVRLEAM